MTVRSYTLLMTVGEPVSLDVQCDWLITQTGMVNSTAGRRLNAIENLPAALTHQWRGSDPVNVASDIRLSLETFGELLHWLTEVQAPDT